MVIAETPRLLIRLFTPDDAAFFAALYGDPQVMELHPVGPMSPEQAYGILEHTLHRYDDPGYGFYAVVLKETGAVIGQCGLLDQMVDGQAEVEIAYKVLPAYWNRGLATEAAAAVRDYGFTRFGFRRLISIVHPANQASQLVCEKNGMQREKQATWHEHENMYIYVIAHPSEEER